MLKKKRDSSKQVNSNGFALFVVGLTFAGFLGGAMRLFLNSERAQTEILNEVQKKFPQWDVKADEVELRLASGIWPGVTVELPRAQVSKKGSCGKPTLDVDVRGLEVPVSLWSLLRGSSRLGHVTVARVDVQFQKNPCPPDSEVKETSMGDGEAIKPSGFKDRIDLRKIYEEINERATGVTLGEVSLQQADMPDWSVRAKDLDLEAGSQITVNSQFSIWKKFSHGELRQDFTLHLGLQGPLLEWKLRSALKEGNFIWSGQIDDEGRTFLQKFRVNQGPLGDFLVMLHRAGFLKKISETKRVWVNCEMTQSGSFDSSLFIKQMPVRLSHCEVDGELGKVAVEPQVFYLKKPLLRNGPLVINVSQLSVDQVTDIFSLPQMEGVFSHLGNWSGSVKLNAFEKIKFAGALENMKVKVSNKSLRGTEVLSRIQTTGGFNGDRIRVELSKFQILGGSQGGHAELKYDLEHKNGSFKVLFSDLSPSESIQNLLFEGRVEPVKLKVNGQLSQEKITHLNAEFSAKEAWGQGWRFTKLSGTLKQLEPEKFGLALRASHFQWKEAFKYDAFADSIAQASSTVISPKELKNLRARLIVDSSGGEVEEASALLVQAPSSRITFQGRWKRGNPLIGKARLGKKKSVAVEVTPRSGHLLQ